MTGNIRPNVIALAIILWLGLGWLYDFQASLLRLDDLRHDVLVRLEDARLRSPDYFYEVVGVSFLGPVIAEEFCLELCLHDDAAPDGDDKRQDHGTGESEQYARREAHHIDQALDAGAAELQGQ